MKKQILSQAIAFFLILTFAPLEIDGSAASDSGISLTYSFGEIVFEEGENGQVVSIEGTEKVNGAGKPNLPSKPVSILIPANKHVKSVSVNGTGLKTYTGMKVEPARNETSFAGDSSGKDSKFVHDTPIYSGKEKYPADYHTEGSMTAIRGYSVFTMVLYPASYQGGTLQYASNLSVTLELEKLPEPLSDLTYVPDKSDEVFLDSAVQNLSAAQTYYEITTTPKYSSGLLLSGKVDYVIITQDSLRPSFEALARHKRSKGLTAQVVTVSSIYNRYSDRGRDNAEKIRNFIKDSYNNNSLTYVLLGGCAGSNYPIVPARLLYCAQVSNEGTNSIAADMYYGCLQGDFDSNGNGVFGEADDDVDLTYDVYVGRAPVSTVAEAQNFVAKTINYEKRKKSQKVSFVGEVLQGNSDGCASELAADAQNDIASKTLTDNLRKLRDTKIKEEYAALYYEADGFIRSLLLGDPKLLLNFSSTLVKHHKAVAGYLSGKSTGYTITQKDVAGLRELCGRLKEEAARSDYAYSGRGLIIDELEYLDSYLQSCAGMTLQKALDGSRYTTSSPPSRLANYIFGGDYLDEIKNTQTKSRISSRDFNTKGFPSSFVKETLYDRDSPNYKWKKSQVISLMNSSPEIVNHLGHANVDSLMKSASSDMKSLKNKEAFFFYSQGCYAGSFDHIKPNGSQHSGHSIAENLVVSSATGGAVAAVANSRYGWYSTTGTDGASQAYHRYFWDRVFSSSANNRNLGAMLARSKHYFIEYLSGHDRSTVMRFCYYTINLLGDPETLLLDSAKAANVSAKGVTINVGKSLILSKGKSVKLKAFAAPVHTTDSVTWKSSKKKVVSVNKKTGKIKAKRPGKAKITAKASGGKKKTVKIVVPKKDKKTKSITLNKASLSVVRGKTAKLKSKIKGSKAGEKWYSSNIRVATVDKKGKVSAKMAGKCVIYCRTASGKQAKANVTVTRPDLN
ncbi:MAG: C25 family cysteine peptidase [Oscillospiraceae bacterium]|nr:C25 family cysteine peptidase [Oscillospiraceae bacterium]